MPARELKKSQQATRITHSQQNYFFMSNGIRKRQIYYNVDYTDEQQKQITIIKKALKREKNLIIEEDQVILRYYYSSDLNHQKCLQRLVKYNQWFTSPEIQTIVQATKSIFRQGFAYSYGKTKDCRAFIILNLSIIDLDKYTLMNYYQALNYTLNKAIKQQFVPGVIENYYIILDLDEKLLTLPISSMGDIIKTIGNAYSMFLQKMMVVNCTTLTKWLFDRAKSFIAEETVRKIKFYTKGDLHDGKLLQFIQFDVLQKKYGGIRHNIHHQREFRDPTQLQQVGEEILSQTQFFSIEQDEVHQYYKQDQCCGMDQQCNIY